MKAWQLHPCQSVSVQSPHSVNFNHYGSHGQCRRLTLSRRQFLNLNDIMQELVTFRHMKYYPIGDNVWLQYSGLAKQLYHVETDQYFTFLDISWKRYKDRVHQSVLSFLEYGFKRIHNRKYYAKNISVHSNRSGGVTQRVSRFKVPSRTTTDGDSSVEQREKCTTFSKRDSAVARSRFQFRRAVDEVRAEGQTATERNSEHETETESRAEYPSDLEDCEHCSIN